jgi:hypothetical protein
LRGGDFSCGDVDFSEAGDEATTTSDVSFQGKMFTLLEDCVGIVEEIIDTILV